MAVRKTKAGLALKRWFKEDWKDQRTGKKCGRQKEKKGAHHIVDQLNVFHQKPQQLHQKCLLLKKESVLHRKKD